MLVLAASVCKTEVHSTVGSSILSTPTMAMYPSPVEGRGLQNRETNTVGSNPTIASMMKKRRKPVYAQRHVVMSTREEGSTRYVVELYTQPLRYRATANLWAWVDRVYYTTPLWKLVDRVYDRATKGKVNGIEDIVRFMPPSARMDCLQYDIEHRGQISLGEVEVDKATYDSLRTR